MPPITKQVNISSGPCQSYNPQLKLQYPRTHLEVKVGEQHCVEVRLFVRRCDRSWFNNDEGACGEFWQLLQDDIIPRMLEDEIEEREASLNGQNLPPPLGPGGIPVAEWNERASKRAKKKRRTGANGKTVASTTESKCMQGKTTEAANTGASANEDTKPTKDVYYACGNGIQLTYRLESINNLRVETLLFGGPDVTDPTQTHFVPLYKLSKRIVIWCYPKSHAGFEPDPEDGGFPRQEFIPLSEMFR